MHPSPEQASPLPWLQPGMPGPPDSRLDEDRGPAERAVGLLENLVAVPSWQDESEALRLLARWLESQGLPSELHHQAGHPLALVSSVGEPDPQDPAGTCLIFNSHIDTVPPAEPDRWSHPPLRLTQEGDTLFGLGVCDAKGSVAAMASAFVELARSWQGPGALRLMVVGGEERGGLGTRMELARGARGSVIIGEPTSIIPRHASKGVLRLEVTSLGRPAHASSPERGFNAIYPMAELLARLQELAHQLRQREKQGNHETGQPSLAVTLIQGGSAPNVIPATCTIHLDRRLVPGESADSAEAEIRALADAAARACPGADFDIRRVRVLEPVMVSKKARIVQVVMQAARTLSPPPPSLLESFPASCDLTWVVHEGGLPGVIWGPGDLHQAHQIDESLPLAELARAVQGYLFAGRLWQESAAWQKSAAWQESAG